MYRRREVNQLRFAVPFNVELDSQNRWVVLAGIMPWEKIEESYAKHFSGTKGQVAKSGRLAFAALYIQSRLAITDEETVAQIRENPSMQFFCGFDVYSTEQPFDPSLMVHFRKRITAEMIKSISEEAFTSQAKKPLDDDNDSDNDDDTDSSTRPRGTLLLDATCCPSDIRYPTDIWLLNHSRELTEHIIDILHGQLRTRGYTKPRTYRQNARRDYLRFSKKRIYTPNQLRNAIRQQLQYVHRNLKTIAQQVEQGADLKKLGRVLQEKYYVIMEVYRQQKVMYDTKTNRIENRLVSISQPYLRPIVRGKARTPVEFGAKVATAHVNGFTFIIHMEYNNFSEGQFLERSAEEYKRLFGFYPKEIIGDNAYPTRDNRNYCKHRGIRLSGQRIGRKTKEVRDVEKRQIYQDGCVRNAVEGDYGTVKRKYGLGLMMTKLYETTLTAISFGFFVKNMERLLRLFVLRFFNNIVSFYFFYRLRVLSLAV